MKNRREVYRGLAMLSQLSLQLLIPILIGVFGGLFLDERLHCSPWITVAGCVIGIAAAFRNLYMWSMREIRRTEKSERVIQARKEQGMPVEEDHDE